MSKSALAVAGALAVIVALDVVHPSAPGKLPLPAPVAAQNR